MIHVFKAMQLALLLSVLFFNDTATTEIYTYYTLFPYTTLFRSYHPFKRRDGRRHGHYAFEPATGRSCHGRGRRRSWHGHHGGGTASCDGQISPLFAHSGKLGRPRRRAFPEQGSGEREGGSEESRVGKAGVRTCRPRGAPVHTNNKRD